MPFVSSLKYYLEKKNKNNKQNNGSGYTRCVQSSRHVFGKKLDKYIHTIVLKNVKISILNVPILNVNSLIFSKENEKRCRDVRTLGMESNVNYN